MDLNIDYAKQVKTLLREFVVQPLKDPQRFAGKQIFSRCTLLYGPQVCGKRQLVDECVIASECELMIIQIKKISYIPLKQRKKQIQKVFANLMQKIIVKVRESKTKSLLFIQGIDQLCLNGENLTEDKYKNEFSGQFLNELLRQIDFLNSNKVKYDKLLIAASDQPWKMDQKLLRRFKNRIYVRGKTESAVIGKMVIEQYEEFAKDLESI